MVKYRRSESLVWIQHLRRIYVVRTCAWNQQSFFPDIFRLHFSGNPSAISNIANFRQISQLDQLPILVHFNPDFNGLVQGRKTGNPWFLRVWWWLSPTPLKNDGLRQLGSWHSQLKMETSSIHVPNHQAVFTYVSPCFYMLPVDVLWNDLGSAATNGSTELPATLLSKWQVALEFAEGLVDTLQKKSWWWFQQHIRHLKHPGGI